ncbi:ribosome recycling factor [Ostreibacterium oceani]|uniref:Ribosome-recycling factor n=1 Tax=Ostreibacterium oceani TaxID=2654998 RepID=A0A6N7F128_9GAMM|nr:ribosome recycling factor [Ostreibacterium oceani]MPV85556.1 ribosome recycling factor [Ostreibacterium oceani]
MIDNIKQDTKSRMAKSIDALKLELSRIRTGRAHPSLLDHVTVDFYGSEVPVGQAANVSNSDARTLTIQPWDKSMVAVIEKAIINSDLGITPTSAGDIIRINLPPLTEERRKDLVKIVRGEGENAKIAIRNIRRDANQSIKNLLNDKAITEDDERRAETDIQKITDDFVAQVDQVLAEKEKDLLAV